MGGGSLHGGCGNRGQKERQIQIWWMPELEAQEEGRHSRSQRSQPFHQGALRVQGQACFQDYQSIPHEEVEGNGQLSCFYLFQMTSESQWAVALDSLMQCRLTAHTIHDLSWSERSK